MNDCVVMSAKKWKELSDWMTKQPMEILNEFPIKPYEIYDYKENEEVYIAPRLKAADIIKDINEK